jgi:hypothetical protein
VLPLVRRGWNGRMSAARKVATVLIGAMCGVYGGFVVGWVVAVLTAAEPMTVWERRLHPPPLTPAFALHACVTAAGAGAGVIVGWLFAVRRWPSPSAKTQIVAAKPPGCQSEMK